MLLLIIGIIIVVCIIIVIEFKIKYIENFDNKEKKDEDIPTFTDNIVNVYDDKGVAINVALIVAPMNNKDKDNYEKYNHKILFLGMTSYLEFPNIVSNKLDLYNDPNNQTWKFDYKNNIKGWFYCFRNPDNYFNSFTPKLLLSESDFADEKTLKPDSSIQKKYDFIYICHKLDENKKTCENDWVTYNKNWKLAIDCLNIMCAKFKLKGLLVGRMGCTIPSVCLKQLDLTEKLPWNDLLQKYKECKFVFVPNIYDASPRIITEALCHDLPLMVNKKILGGWKYINDETGVFFNDLNDFEYNLEKLLKNLHTYRPRKFFIEHIVREKKCYILFKLILIIRLIFLLIVNI